MTEARNTALAFAMDYYTRSTIPPDQIVVIAEQFLAFLEPVIPTPTPTPDPVV